MTSTPNDRPMEPSTSTGAFSPDAPVSDPTTSYASVTPDPTYDTAAGDFGRPDAGRGDSDSTADVAKQEAAAVKDTAVDAGKNVADTAKDEAANVVAQTKVQAKSLLDSVGAQVSEQAGTQQHRLQEAVHGLAGELESMVSGSQESGPLTDLARQGADKGGEIARWLDRHEPTDVLTEVKSFARRRPVMFLVLCGAAGVVAGRLTRGAIGANTSLDTPDRGGSVGRPAVSAGPSASLVEEPALGDTHPADPYASDPELSQGGPIGAPGMPGALVDPVTGTAPVVADYPSHHPDVTR